MIKKLTKFTKEITDFAFNHQNKIEERLCPFMENKSEYEEFLLNEFKYDDFYIIENSDELLGLLIVNPDSNNQIIGLWAKNTDLKEKLFKYAWNNYNEMVCVYLSSKNKDIQSICDKYELIKDSDEIIMEIKNNIDFKLGDDISRERISKMNFNKYVEDINKYFPDVFWNNENLINELDKRILFAYYDEENILGIGSGYIYDQKVSEVFGVGAKDKTNYYTIHSDLISYLKNNSEKVIIFVDSEDDYKYLTNLGFNCVFKASFYVSPKLQNL